MRGVLSLRFSNACVESQSDVPNKMSQIFLPARNIAEAMRGCSDPFTCESSPNNGYALTNGFFVLNATLPLLDNNIP